ncbi:peptidase MA family metallohydrolase [Spongisporangium articulatum]|uniref:Peptidase MA family metallohydrolase n=1 Tax=Spongisporangium articulatum TaxID=3362603 RepID=A0ABW8ASY8_9ACTN
MPGREVVRRVLAVAGMLALGFLTVVGVVHGQPVAAPVTTPPTSAGAPREALDVAAVDALLATRARAVSDDDRAAWAGTVAPVAQPLQGQVFDRLRVLRPVRWTYTRVGEPVRAGATRMRVDVRLTYELADGGPTVTRPQTWVLQLDGGPKVLSTASTATPDLWDLTPVVRRTANARTDTGDARCTVVAAASRRPVATQLVDLCPDVLDTVQKAVRAPGADRAPVTLVVPQDVGQLATLLGRTDPAGLDRTAAITVGVAHQPAEAVLINPEAFGQLRAVGRRVVLTHELVHVATRAVEAGGTATVPTWLDEGTADEIAYAATDLDAETIAGPVLDQARAGRYPTRLPTSAAFDATGAAPDLAYAQAWSAADTIEADKGVAGLLKVHRLVAGGTSLDAALQQVLGTGTAGFVSMWQQHLGRLVQNP